MGPVEAIRSGFERALDFRGRSTRPEYWWWQLMTAVGALFVGEEPSALVSLVILALFVPSLAVAVRRLHDTGRSGWTLLLAVVPVIGVIVLLIRMVQPGDAASNRFGPPPQPMPTPPEPPPPPPLG